MRMNIRSDCFYICLMIHCFIYQGEAASDDQRETQTRERSRKWTTGKEADLIFFDVLTDTGKPNHFDRIRAKWREEHPDSNVTDSGLRNKLQKLREESLAEGERKRNFKWNQRFERELLDVYYDTSSYKKRASTRLEKEWKRRHPDYQASRKCLLLRVQRLLKKNKYPEYEQQRRTIEDHEDEESEETMEYKWTSEWNDTLRSIDKLTNTGEPYQIERIKSKWFEKYPDSNVTECALRSQLGRLRRESQEEGKRKRNFKWDEESERELLNIYLNTYPYRHDVDITLEAEWNSRHQGFNMLRKYLVNRARKLMRANKYSEYRAQELSTTDFHWDDYHNSELMHIRKIAGPERGPDVRKTHRTWSALHPGYPHVTPDQLRERLNHLKKNPPNEDFPWTKEENQDLLEIYDETMPEKEDQGQRIYDIWSRRHPRYSYMTPYYLQVHASTLARKREVEAAGMYVRSKWTDEEKADLVQMVHKYSRERLDELQAFHEEWVRKHPRLAYKTNTDLIYAAKQFKIGGIAAPSIETEEGSQSRLLELKHRKRNKYTPRLKQELLDVFNRTYPKDHGYTRRLKQIWDKRHEDLAPIKASSLRRNVRLWKERGPDKRPDKAPMVYSSDEAGSPSVAGMSGDSE